MTRKPEIIVIGGSAGALEPLLGIVGALPDELRAPVVVVLHMAPRQPSQVPDLLARVTKRTVREPDDKEPLVPGTIYIAPPNYHMLIERSGRIALSVDDPVNFSRPSIDVLFESAADAYGAGVVGLVLSGANHDGAQGLRRIADGGGIALVQAPACAEHDVMPRSALERVPSAHQLADEQIAAFLGGIPYSEGRS
jgi:two-component system, chemotaxis family, protein-glutamate methylesterase/glutaminase